MGGATPIKDATEQAEAAHGEKEETGEGRLYYVCPMPEHSTILYDKPGKCPICGMPLVPVRRREGTVEKPRIKYWTCPMPEHSSVHEKGPGKCPICGMSLIPVTEEPSSQSASNHGHEHEPDQQRPKRDHEARP